MRLSSARSAFFRPNSRAISLVPTLPGLLRIKATMASRVGKPLSGFCFTYPRAFPALFFADVFAGFAAEVLASALTGARALLTASDLDLAGFFAEDFFTALADSASSASISLGSALAFLALGALAAGFAVFLA